MRLDDLRGEIAAALKVVASSAFFSHSVLQVIKGYPFMRITGSKPWFCIRDRERMVHATLAYDPCVLKL